MTMVTMAAGALATEGGDGEFPLRAAKSATGRSERALASGSTRFLVSIIVDLVAIISTDNKIWLIGSMPTPEIPGGGMKASGRRDALCVLSVIRPTTSGKSNLAKYSL
jgi:hypothetical protein